MATTIGQNGDNHWSKRRQPLVNCDKYCVCQNGDNGTATNQINEDDNCNFIRLMNCINIILILYVVGITIGNKNAIMISYPNYISIVFERNEAICVGSLISVFMRCKPGSRMCSNVCYSHLPIVRGDALNISSEPNWVIHYKLGFPLMMRRPACMTTIQKANPLLTKFPMNGLKGNDQLSRSCISPQFMPRVQNLQIKVRFHSFIQQ